MDGFDRAWIAEVRNSRHGKRIAGTIWIHSSAAPGALVEWTMNHGRADHEIDRGEVLIRVDRSDDRIALLHYPSFLTEAHPVLCCSTLVDLETGHSQYRSFAGRSNRPILHRKELLVAPAHEAYNEFASLTREEERLGLLEDKARIGWSRYWTDLLKSRGLTIEGHRITERTADD